MDLDRLRSVAKLAPLDYQRLEASVVKAVGESMKQDGARVTVSEVNRRVGICCAVLDDMLRAHGWTVQRAADHVLVALRAKLDGTPWEPEKLRSSWAPEVLATGGRRDDAKH